jgi:hypothetical protein
MPPKTAEPPVAAAAPRIAEVARAEPPKVDVKAPPVDERKAEPAKAEVKSPATAPAPPPSVKGVEAAKEEPAKADSKAPTAPAPAEKAPEKPAEKVSERAMDRWERMATKVLERVGKESNAAEEPLNKNR